MRRAFIALSRSNVACRFIHNLGDVPNTSARSSAAAAVIPRLPLISSFNRVVVHPSLAAKAACDVGGHYSRPDILQLLVNRRPVERVIERDHSDSRDGVRHNEHPLDSTGVSPDLTADGTAYYIKDQAVNG